MVTVLSTSTPRAHKRSGRAARRRMRYLRLGLTSVVTLIGTLSFLTSQSQAHSRRRVHRVTASPSPSDMQPLLQTASQSGMASWYAPGNGVGHRTAQGDTFDSEALTAAHPNLPFGTRLLVHAPRTGRSIIVRVNDRGPYSKHRIIDLSRAAASRLGILQAGVAHVTIRVIPRGSVSDESLVVRNRSENTPENPQDEVASLPR